MSQTQSDPEINSHLEVLRNLVNQVFEIDQITLGGTQEPYLIKYLGLLNQPSEEAYEKLQAALLPHQLTPVFRFYEDKHQVILKKGLVSTEPVQKRTNIILFIITFISILFSGMLTSYTGPQTNNIGIIWSHLKGNLGQSIAFAISMLSILTAHEFGHYFAARYHKTRVTLPYFIPFPLSPFGTMGAFIRMLEPPKNRKILLDIGLAGPLAGLIIAIPVLVIGLSLSPVETLPANLPEGFLFEGNSILYLILKYLVHGAWLPQPLSFFGANPIIHWMRYFFTGLPLPVGGVDVMIHPVAWAGWAGLLITSLNLLPAGQLDGGHLVYSLFGDKLQWIRPAILVVLVLLGFMWSGWWLWALLIFLLGRVHAEPLDQITPLDPNRRVLAVFGLLVFILVFTPVPLSIFGV